MMCEDCQRSDEDGGKVLEYENKLPQSLSSQGSWKVNLCDDCKAKKVWKDMTPTIQKRDVTEECEITLDTIHHYGYAAPILRHKENQLAMIKVGKPISLLYGVNKGYEVSNDTNGNIRVTHDPRKNKICPHCHTLMN